MGGDLFGEGVMPSDCDHTQQFVCDDGMLNCYCDTNAPISPSDCVKTADYHCQQWEPIELGCQCIADSPAEADDCPPEGGGFQCHSYDPPIGCDCNQAAIA